MSGESEKTLRDTFEEAAVSLIYSLLLYAALNIFLRVLF